MADRVNPRPPDYLWIEHVRKANPVEVAAIEREADRPSLDGPEFGRVFGRIMQKHPKADVRLVNDILRTVVASLDPGPPPDTTPEPEPGQGKR